MKRVVLFAEVPAFYASVERADDPQLAARPVIVGGDPRKRGLVQAASHDALACGVRPDMSVLEALRLCPEARIVRTDMTRYREVSRRLFACVRREFERLEPFGLGAAYLDATATGSQPGSIAARLCERVREELGLPLRVGIASSKFLARLAAEEAGAQGVLRIEPGAEDAFLRPLPAARLDGVGQKTEATLAELGAHTIGDVVELDRAQLEQALGAHGLRIQACARGAEDEPVRAARHPQSLSRELTLEDGARDWAALGEALLGLAQRLEEELLAQGLTASRIILKLRFADQGRTTRSRTLGAPVAAASELHSVALGLLQRTQAGSRPLRGLGLQLSGLGAAAESDRQLALFPPRR